MTVDFENKTAETAAGISAGYAVFEQLKHPVSIFGKDGAVIYGNKPYHELFFSGTGEVRIDGDDPFLPEYRKKVIQSYNAAVNGVETRCFAIINSPAGRQVPLEIYFMPMFGNGSVQSILTLMMIVDEQPVASNRQAAPGISGDNYQYDNLHFEFSPMPIMRVNEELQIIKCSHSLESFIGYSVDEILTEKLTTFDGIYSTDTDRVKKAVTGILSGDLTLHRIGEVKVAARDEKKIVNLTLYPVIQEKQIVAAEIIIEDITRIKELKDRINAAGRTRLFSDITKGFLHSLNNTINVILSKTQLLLQITEKETVIDGIQVMEESALEIAGQIKRIQNFIGGAPETSEEMTEPLVDIIEDAIEFSKMQFKVYNIDNTKSIQVEKKYFSTIHVTTNTRLLREIITSIILKISNSIQKAGVINLALKQNHDLQLSVEAVKDAAPGAPPVLPSFVNIFSGIDIRQVADMIGLKIIEEESPQSYAIKAIFPSRILIDREKRETGDSDYRIRDMDIIIVEDEIPLQKILFELFDKMGNRVYLCDNGKQAIEEFKKKPYDMVITDYGIPGITGIELSARIKEINEDAITVLLSGWLLDNIKAYKNVVDLFLPKPFKLDELLKKIGKLMTEKKISGQ